MIFADNHIQSTTQGLGSAQSNLRKLNIIKRGQKSINGDLVYLFLSLSRFIEIEFLVSIIIFLVLWISISIQSTKIKEYGENLFQ